MAPLDGRQVSILVLAGSVALLLGLFRGDPVVVVVARAVALPLLLWGLVSLVLRKGPVWRLVRITTGFALGAWCAYALDASALGMAIAGATIALVLLGTEIVDARSS